MLLLNQLDIMGVLLDKMPLCDILSFQMVDKVCYNTVLHYNTINHRIKRQLKQDNILDLINKHDFYLSGSYLLSILTGEYYNTDIDLYVSKSNFEEINTDLEKLGYDCRGYFDDVDPENHHYLFDKYMYKCVDYYKPNCTKIQVIFIQDVVTVNNYIYYNFDFDFLRSFLRVRDNKFDLRISNRKSIQTRYCMYSINQLQFKGDYRLDKYERRGYKFEPIMDKIRLNVFDYLKLKNKSPLTYRQHYNYTLERNESHYKRFILGCPNGSLLDVQVVHPTIYLPFL
jgi:hypothetical protein